MYGKRYTDGERVAHQIALYGEAGGEFSGTFMFLALLGGHKMHTQGESCKPSQMTQLTTMSHKDQGARCGNSVYTPIHTVPDGRKMPETRSTRNTGNRNIARNKERDGEVSAHASSDDVGRPKDSQTGEKFLTKSPSTARCIC